VARTLAAGQADLAARSELAPVLLVHLRTFTNYTSSTVESDFYWTRDYPVHYPWNGGADVEFEDAILSIGDVVRRMEHQPNGALIDLRQTAMELRLSNDLDSAGVSRWQTLRTKNLPFATLEVATLLVPPHRLRDAAFWDFRDLVGTEHVYHFRGELTQVGTVTETEIPLTFEQREPNLDWPVCTAAAECDPRHLGKRYAIPVGRAKSVPVTNRTVGWVTTLAQQITSSATGNTTVTDASGFPGTGSFTVQLGAERVTASYVNATTINISARGQASTTAIAHNQGEVAVEILSSAVFVFSGVEAKALDALYVISPLTGEKVLIDSSLYSVNLANTGVDSGRTLATVTFTAANFQTMVDRMATVSQQPDAGPITIQVPWATYAVDTASPYSSGLDGTFSSSPAGIRIEPLAGPDEAGKWWWPTSAGIPNASDSPVLRWRPVVKCNAWSLSGGVATVLKIRCNSLYGTSFTETLGTVTAGAGTWLNLTLAGAWRTPGSSYTVGSIDDATGGTQNIWTWIENGGGGSGFFDNTHNGAFFYTDTSYLEVELENTAQTDLAIAALSLGFGLDFVADVQGAQTSGTLHESGPDILEWFLEVFAGLGGSAADATTFAAAETNLGSNVFAGVLNLAGDTFGQVVARLCFEMRANLVARESSSGTTYLLYAAESDYEWPAAAFTLAELREQTETEKSAAEQATRFRGLYDARLDPTATSIGEDDLRELVRIDVNQNDASALLATALLTAAETKWGARDAEPAVFLFIADTATAVDVLAYYAHEAIRRAPLIGCTVPWGDGYALELGDLVSLTPRGHTSAVKARVIQTVVNLAQPHVGLVLYEVP